jgi:protein O-mannosyl-transferase
LNDKATRRWSFVICLFLALAVWAVFGQTRRHEFITYDDRLYVYDNPAVTQGLSWRGVAWAFTHSLSANWHPLTTLSHTLDCQLWGLNPGSHHLTNVLLHAATAILLFLVLRRMTGVLWPAAFAAAVFAIHPLRVESVAWVAERKDVLSGLFFMLTLWAYAQYAQQSIVSSPSSVVRSDRATDPAPRFTLRASRFYALSLAFFALGLMSKPMLVTLPFVLWLLDYWPLGRMQRAEAKMKNAEAGARLHARRSTFPWQPPFIFHHSSFIILEKIPFLLLSAAACVAAVLAQKQAIVTVQEVDFPARMGNALLAYTAYLGQTLYPAGLAVLYPHPGSRLPVWRVGLSVLALLLISAGVLAGRRKHPYLLVGWLWYLGMLVPVIGLVQVGVQARADRYTYLPQIGLCVLVAWGAVDLCGCWRYRRLALGGAAAAVLCGLLAGAHAQTEYWKNNISLWTHALACTSENSMAHYNLGLALAMQGKLPEAINHYERALQLNPDFAEVHNNLGDVLTIQGKLAQAARHCERALQLNPDYAEAHNNLGIVLAMQGNLPEAIPHYERALQLSPDSAEAHNNLGNALIIQGKLAEAVQHCQRALQLNPNFAEAHFNLGNALASRGKLNEAVLHFQQALTLATSQNNPALAETLRARLKSYQPSVPQPQTP